MLPRIATIFFILFSLSACTSIFFFPQKQWIGTPDKIGIDYESVTLSAHDGTELSGWLLKTHEQRKGVIYFLHGNAENISTHFASVFWLPEQGYDVFLLDYRGYGHSNGKAQLPEIYDDIDSGFDWLSKHYPDEGNKTFLGQSIGASLGIYWMAHSPAAQSGLKKIVLDAPFPRYPQMVSEVLQRSWMTWLFAKPVSWCFSSRYDALGAVSDLPKNTPILFFQSSAKNSV